MSHYAVLLVLPSYPTDELIVATLQPFHEYECTGVDDQYVVDVDMTDEVTTDWLAPVKVVRLADGSLHSRWDDKFYTGPADDAIFPKPTFQLPEGATETEVPRNESGEYADIVAFATDYHNYEHRDGKFWRRTNPNSHWDWYQLGGRYSGKLRTLDSRGVKGSPGVMGSELDPNGVDIAQRGNLAFSAMQSARNADRRSWVGDILSKSELTHDELESALLLKPEVDRTWREMADPKPRGAEYHEWIGKTFATDAGHALMKAEKASWELPVLGRHATLNAWLTGAPALTAWAVVHEGQWTEKGSMGWWGVSTGDMDQDEWEAKVSTLVEGMPTDHWLAVVDCHI